MTIIDSDENDVVQDWKWADGYVQQVKKILKENTMHMIAIDDSSPEQDMKESTDLVVKTMAGKVAVRIRRANCQYRDLTIRSWRASGAKTELPKIKEGFGDFYLYAWEDKNSELSNWILVNLDTLRKSGLLENRRTILNPDGITGFINITVAELRLSGCLTAYCL